MLQAFHRVSPCFVLLVAASKSFQSTQPLPQKHATESRGTMHSLLPPCQCVGHQNRDKPEPPVNWSTLLIINFPAFRVPPLNCAVHTNCLRKASAALSAKRQSPYILRSLMEKASGAHCLYSILLGYRRQIACIHKGPAAM
ncbi:hypothetical protein SDC9_06738 [bioreactor metagenome]|uniref:Uncharacterized protein n=1 Tax=bioreactor metagenome TaxID=1076179 RepID=A0A644T2Q1_9ZZZZ